MWDSAWTGRALAATKAAAADAEVTTQRPPSKLAVVFTGQSSLQWQLWWCTPSRWREHKRAFAVLSFAHNTAETGNRVASLTDTSSRHQDERYHLNVYAVFREFERGASTSLHTATVRQVCQRVLASK